MRQKWKLFTSLIGQLCKPLDYLRVEHPQKRLADLWIPLILGLTSTAVLLALPSPVKITGSGGLISIFTGLLQILTGFYIASLAAVATFERSGMDEPMQGKPPKLNIKVRGIWETEQLTRRRFLSLMFGYLSFLSFFLYFFGAFVDLLEPNLIALMPALAFQTVKWVCLTIYLCLVSNLGITTLLGLFYMTERIHRDEPKLIIKE